MRTGRTGIAVLSAALVLAGCGGSSTPKSSPLPTATPGPSDDASCGDKLPRTVAATLAGTKDYLESGALGGATGGALCYLTLPGKAPQQLVVNISVTFSSADQAAANAFRSMFTQPAAPGYRLPASEGYGAVYPTDNGVKGHRAAGSTASGDVIVSVLMVRDANGRNPYDDVHALLRLLGPQLAPSWPAAPPGIDVSKPTSPPPGFQFTGQSATPPSPTTS
jgi:hypothetical protein